jgi:BirA family biotin operon repressor/biotin-[acetyl-CoA-carboxylase] ligase
MLSAVVLSVKAKFCSMPDRTEALAAELQSRLQTTSLGRVATILMTTTSTQDVARGLASKGCPEGQLVWGLEQTAGRGRLDRQWVSGPDAGLWFSIVLRPQLTADAASFLPLAAGVGVATALARHTNGQVQLKWPNDVLLDGGKLGGILAEAEVSGGVLRYVVLGVGVNLVPPRGVDGAVSVAALGSRAHRPDEAAVLADVLLELERAYGALGGGTEALRRRWLELSDTIGREVRAEVSGGTIVGKAVDLAADGALLIQPAGGEPQAVRFGDVVHLRSG